MKKIVLAASVLFGYCMMRLKKSPEKETEKAEKTEDTEDEIKFSCTKWYIDIEYDGSIARFDGELGMDCFYANANSLMWVKWNNRRGHVVEEDRIKIIRKAQEYKKNNFRVIFFDEHGNEMKHLPE